MVETKPEKIIFWYHFLPSTPVAPNWWFERTQADASSLGISCTRPLIDLSALENVLRSSSSPATVELVLARDFDHIFGNPISKFAHKADVLRLEALILHGGIYLDLDVYTVRSFAPLLHFPTVLGLEGGIDGLPVQGLCNGVIVAERNASFIQRWYNEYKDFKDEDWAGLSVKLPLELAMHHSEEVLVLDPYALFYPACESAILLPIPRSELIGLLSPDAPTGNNHGLRAIHSHAAHYNGESWDFDSSHQFAYHAWSSFTTSRWLSKLTPDSIWDNSKETSFTELARRWVGDDLRAEWKEARKAGKV